MFVNVVGRCLPDWPRRAAWLFMQQAAASLPALSENNAQADLG